MVEGAGDLPISRDEITSGDLGRQRQARLLYRRILACVHAKPTPEASQADALDQELKELRQRAGVASREVSVQTLLAQVDRWKPLIPADAAAGRALMEQFRLALPGEPEGWPALEALVLGEPPDQPQLKPQVFSVASWPVGVKLGALLVIFSLIPALLVGNIGAFLAQQQAEHAQQKKLIGLADLVAGRLDQEIESYRQLVRYLASEPELIAMTAAQGVERKQMLAPVLGLLDRVNDSHANSAFIYVLDRKGRCIASSDRKLIGFDYSFRTYFQKGMQQPFYVSGTYLPISTSRHDPLISIASPLRRGSEVVGAVVVATYTMAQSKALQVHQGLTAMVVEGDGLIASASDPKLRLGVLGPEGPLAEATRRRVSFNPSIDQGKRFRRLLDVHALSPSLQPLLRAPRPGLAVGQLDAQAVDAAWSPLEVKGWTAVVFTPRAYLIGARRAVQRRVLLLTSLLGLLATLAAMAASRTVSRPLRVLTSAAIQLENDRPIEESALQSVITRRDDLGLLGKRLLEAARESSRRMANLKAQVATMRIEIDLSRRDREVDAIVDNEFFAELKSAAADLRRQRKERQHNERQRKGPRGPNLSP